MFFLRFHFSKALFAKMKGKFRLASFFSRRASADKKRVAFVLQQYLCLPLLRPEDMKAQVAKLEAELRSASLPLTAYERQNVNKFHKYFVRYWCQHVGPSMFTVFKAPYTTNNRLER